MTACLLNDIAFVVSRGYDDDSIDIILYGAVWW